MQSLNNPEWWLVIVGFLTLAVVAYQAIETAKATKAMRDNTSAFIESQRPIIAAEAKGHPLEDLSSDIPRMKIALSNKGTTTAYDCLHESWIELVTKMPDEFEDFSSAADYFKSKNKFSLYPGHDPIVINIPIRRGLSETEREAVRGARLYVCVRVRLSFRDSFAPERYSNFGFWVMYEGMGFLPKYNDSN